MPDRQTIEQRVAQHYTQGNLGRQIFEAPAASGKDLHRVSMADLSAVDELHPGGRHDQCPA